MLAPRKGASFSVLNFSLYYWGTLCQHLIFLVFSVPLEIDASNGPLPSDGVLGHGERGNHAFLHPEEFRIIH